MDKYVEEAISGKYQKIEAVTYYMKDCMKVGIDHYAIELIHFVYVLYRR